MPLSSNDCLQCGRKIIQSISNRCMYCGVDLPEEHQLSQQEKSRFLQEKMEALRENEENADQLVNEMRQDFGIPEQWKPSKKRKQASEQKLSEVHHSITSLAGGRLWEERGQDRRKTPSAESEWTGKERRKGDRRTR